MLPETSNSPADDESREMDLALHQMRQAEGAHFDAVMAIRDAETLRLYALQQDIEPLVRNRAEAAEFINPALQTGTPPKLWIDLTSYVVMAPDPRTYRLVQDTRDGRQTIAETADRTEMTEMLRDFIAHRLVTRQRALEPASKLSDGQSSKHSTAALILAWLAGFSLGVLSLLIVGVTLAKF